MNFRVFVVFGCFWYHGTMAGGGSLFTTTLGRHIHLDPPPPLPLVTAVARLQKKTLSFLSYILSDGRCFIFMDGLRKDWARSICTVTAIDDGRKKGATAGHCSPWTAGSRQKLLKRVGHDLAFTRAMASLPWPAKPWCGITYLPK